MYHLSKKIPGQDMRCSFWPNKLGGISWKQCCIEHDYACADAKAKESEKLRKIADTQLRNCVNRILPLMGEIMYVGVRSYNFYKKVIGKPEY